MLAKSEMVALVAVSLDDDNQVSQTLTVSQLAEHHHKQLVPAREVLHIVVAIVFGHNSIEFAPVKKRSKLSINVFVLIHVWVISHKDTNSNPFSRKTSANN
jgi:hypothetical protein